MRVMAATLALLMLLSGCVSSNSEGNTDPDAGMNAEESNEVPEAFELDANMSDCANIELLGPEMDASALADLVPAGFSVSNGAVLVLGAMVCPSGEVERGFWAIQVTPTDPALESPNAGNHYWIVEHYIAENTEFHGTMSHIRAITTHADVTIRGGIQSHSFSIAAADNSYEWSGNGPVGPEAWTVAGPVFANNAFREYFAADGGYAYIDATFGGDSGAAGAGAGTLNTLGENPGAVHYGPASQHAALYATNMAYADAKIGFIPYEA